MIKSSNVIVRIAHAIIKKMDTTPILRVAAKAVIVNDAGEVLLVREAVTDPDNTQVGLWGVPGGRLEPGEGFQEGLVREALEETGLHVTPVKPLYVGEWRPVIRGQAHQIIAIFMVCKVEGGTVKVSDEHDDYMWIHPRERSKYNLMSPDDRVMDALLATS